MEPVALILIGAALFCHSWYILGLYPDGRTMGVYVGSLGLAALITLTFDPVLLLIPGDPQSVQALIDVGGHPDKASPLVEITVMKMLIISWAGYAIGVAAQGLWDYDERAIGFYCVLPAAASVVAVLYFFTTLFDPYGNPVTLGLSAEALLLSIVAGTLFFYLAIPFVMLRQVAGWFTLVGSIAVVTVGLLMVSTVIKAT